MTVALSSTSNPALSPTSPSNGCSASNLIFSNFSVGQATGSINSVALVATNNGFQPGPGDIFLTTAPSPNTGIELGSPMIRGANTLDCDQNTGPQTVGFAAFCISGKNQSLVSTISYQITSSTPGGTISQLGLGATVISHANVTTAVVFREVCLGGVFTNSTGGSSGCGGGAANYLVFQAGSVQGNFTTLTQQVGTTFAPASIIGIRDTVFLQTFNGAGSFAQALPFDFITPEPATFGTVCAALVCLGFLRRWRRPRS